MEPLTINQELYNLSLADLSVIAELLGNPLADEKDSAKLLLLVCAEIKSRIDLIKSKI
jgi:hypothetical protein